MTKTITSPTRIAVLERLDNSRSHNPRFRVHIQSGATFTTKPDAQVAYVIENSEYQDVPVRFTLEDGEIIGIERVTP